MNDIAFTFGFITDGSQASCTRLMNIVDSINRLHIPQFEIIIVGPKDKIQAFPYLGPNELNIKVINFDDSIKPKWITKKKNIITTNAKYDNIVYAHDYIYFDDDWYEGYKKFGDNFVACMNKIKNIDGTRYRDWVIFPDSWSEKMRHYAGIGQNHNKHNESLLPYDEVRFSKWQYFSGAYWVAKKWLMEEIPLEEFLVWGDGEDCRWSHYVRSKYDFSMNQNSTVQLLTTHDPAFVDMKPECYKKLIEYYEKVQCGEIKEWWQ